MEKEIGKGIPTGTGEDWKAAARGTVEVLASWGNVLREYSWSMTRALFYRC